MSTPNPFGSASFAGAVDLSALASRSTSSPGNTRPSSPAAGGDYVIDVTEATFQADVLERSLRTPVVLDLWADWCGPCKQLSPVLEKLAREGGGAWILAKIDVDANPRIAQALRVQGIPAVKAIFQGQLVAEFTGAVPEPEVRKWIQSLVEAAGGTLPASQPENEESEPDDPRIVAAEDAVARGDLAEATRRYQEVLAAEPDHPLAGQALRQVELLRRAWESGPQAVTEADARPDDIDAAFAAADVEMSNGQIDEAFRRLINLVARSRGEEKERVRARLVELFSIVGEDDPRVRAARRDLTAALF